jgi:hypothetical protein
MANTTFLLGDDSGEVVSGSTPLQVEVTITEVDADGDGDGDLQVGLKVVDGFTADLRGFFFNVPNDSLLDNLTVTGDDVNGQEYDTDGDGIRRSTMRLHRPPRHRLTPWLLRPALN